jgi:SAM-dependent methyltransferase
MSTDPTLAASSATESAPTRSAAAAAEAAWAARVRAHHEQTARLRETPEGGDFYAPVSRTFISDPRRSDDEVLDLLVSLAVPDESWLDIGAGAGRYALPLALRVHDVIALDPSPAMLAALREQAAEHGIANVRTVEARWPVDPAAAPAPTADAALIANLGYDVEAIGPFLDAMEAAAGRICVAILVDRPPARPAHAFWPPVHGEARAELPALDDFLDLLIARGRSPHEVRVPRPPHGFAAREELNRWLRNQLFVEPGSAKDAVLARELERRVVDHPDGSVTLASQVPMMTGVVAWAPR